MKYESPWHGEIYALKINVGQKVKKCETLFHISSDWSSYWVMSPYEGTITKLYVKEGDIVKDGDILFEME